MPPNLAARPAGGLPDARRGYGALYVIGVEKSENGAETEVDLYFTAAGELVREVVDADPYEDYEEYLPQMPAARWTAGWPGVSPMPASSTWTMKTASPRWNFAGRRAEARACFQGNFVMLKTEYERTQPAAGGCRHPRCRAEQYPAARSKWAFMKPPSKCTTA